MNVVRKKTILLEEKSMKLLEKPEYVVCKIQDDN